MRRHKPTLRLPAWCTRSECISMAVTGIKPHIGRAMRRVENHVCPGCKYNMQNRDLEAIVEQK